MDFTKRLLTIFILITAIAFCDKAFADSIQPTSTEAGAVNKKIDKEVNDNLLDINNETKKKEDQSKYENNLNNETKMNASVVKTGFILKEVKFEGNTVYSKEDLNKIVAGKIGTYIELGQMKDLMNEITAHYENNGYITSFAYLPAQKIKGGILTINVVESKIAEVQIKENKWTKTGFLKNNVFKANGIKEGSVFNIHNLKKSLGKMNEMNYLKSRVTLQKADDNESTKIVLEVQDRYPLKFSAGWDNKGRDLIGVQRSILTVANENITGYGDRLYVSNVLAHGTYGVNTNYFLPLGPYGTELRLGYGYSNVELGRDQKPRGINGRAHDFNVGLIQPIYEGKTFKITSDVTLDMLRARTNINNDVLNNKYDLRALRTGINAIKDDSHGRWISRLEVNTGLPILGATTTHRVAEGSSKFVTINPSLVRVQSLPFKTTGIFKISGQYSPNYLLPVEQWQVGGMDTVRGFKEGLLFGDKGYFMNVELRKTLPFLPDTKFIKMKDRVALALFYDQGYARSKGIKANYKNFLQSTGFGFRINMTRYMRANLDFGVPLGRERTTNQKGMRFHFSINSDLI